MSVSEKYSNFELLINQFGFVVLEQGDAVDDDFFGFCNHLRKIDNIILINSTKKAYVISKDKLDHFSISLEEL